MFVDDRLPRLLRLTGALTGYTFICVLEVLTVADLGDPSTGSDLAEAVPH